MADGILLLRGPEPNTYHLIECRNNTSCPIFWRSKRFTIELEDPSKKNEVGSDVMEQFAYFRECGGCFVYRMADGTLGFWTHSFNPFDEQADARESLAELLEELYMI